MQRARDDIRVVRLREEMLRAIQGAVELWSTDAEVSEVRPFFPGGGRGGFWSDSQLPP